jgi:hypothetical protein
MKRHWILCKIASLHNGDWLSILSVQVLWIWTLTLDDAYLSFNSDFRLTWRGEGN